MDTIVAVVDSRIWLPTGLTRQFIGDLRKQFTHANPDFFKRRSMGRATWGVSSKITTMDEREDPIFGKRPTLPRGGSAILTETCKRFGYDLKWIDRRASVPVEWPPFVVDPNKPELELRHYQTGAIAEAARRQQGIVKAPTGSGKTVSALALLSRLGERALVIMRDGNLLKQWVRAAGKNLGMTQREIGIVKGGKFKPGAVLTLALQQSLYSKGETLNELLRDQPFGAVVVDEAQTVAAKTFQIVIDRFPAKYRIGFSADETRRDGMEFLIYDAMGKVIHDTSRSDLEDSGFIHKVDVRAVATEFRADWYRDAPPEDRDFKVLVDEIIDDEARNEVLLDTVAKLVDAGSFPVIIWTHRREHATWIDQELTLTRRIPCGLLIGGAGADGERFEIDSDKIRSGALKVAVGTYNALGTGIDLPSVRAGICATPISAKNPQFFNQVRGRLVRTAQETGKDSAVLCYLWDRFVFPRHLNALKSWNDDRVEMFAA